MSPASLAACVPECMATPTSACARAGASLVPSRVIAASFDPRLLGRLFRHLLKNAARYSPPGNRITRSDRTDPERLEFEVKDNGPGIDKADLPLIFEKFYRGKKGRQDR
ncbi:MAG: sensor histidine kinase [Acidobacteriota bacterium]|nr:sensor histidine kinase [Acidobacteriota bacterium]